MERLKINLWFTAGVGSCIGLILFNALGLWILWALCWVPWIWFVLWRHRAIEWKRVRLMKIKQREAELWLTALKEANRERKYVQ